MVVAHTHAKDQGQKSIGSKDRVETDGRTDGGVCICITSHANAVDNKTIRMQVLGCVVLILWD